MKGHKYFIIALFLISQLLYSQSSLFGTGEGTGNQEAVSPVETADATSPVTSAPDDGKESDSSVENIELPAGYGSILLGMEMDDVKELLLTEPRFDFRGDPDVSIQRNGNQQLISSRGRAFIDQGFFQFNDSRLYLIIINMNPERMDFFSMQQTLTAKYGEPEELSPEGLYWRNENVQLSLEYPLTVKYLDLEVFESFIQEDVRLKSFQEISRSKFLEEF